MGNCEFTKHFKGSPKEASELIKKANGYSFDYNGKTYTMSGVKKNENTNEKLPKTK